MEAGKRGLRWGMPQLNADGSIVVAHVRAENNKDRWLLAVDPESGKTRVLDALHDDAWVREVGGFGQEDPSFGWLPDQKTPLVPVGARRLDASLRGRRRGRAAGGAPADAGQVGDRFGRPVGRQEEVLHHQQRSGPGERHVYACRLTAASGRS